MTKAVKRKSDIDGVLYFPFCPGIAWSVRNGKCKIKKSSAVILDSKLQNNNIITVAYGGLLESYCSLYFLEAANIIFPSSSLFWDGNNEYKGLIEANGLARIPLTPIGERVIFKYPLPIFFDKEDQAYLNCLYNYYGNTCLGLKGNLRLGSSPAFKIISNNPFGIKDRFIPKMRDLNCPESLAKSLMLQKINTNKFFVLLVPDRDKLSRHNVTCFKWDVAQVKSFHAALKQNDIQLIIATNETGKYYSFPCVVPLNVENVMYLLNRAGVILSRDLDYLLVGYMMGVVPISEKQKKAYSLYNIAGRLKTGVKYYESKKMAPMEVIDFIKKIRSTV